MILLLSKFFANRRVIIPRALSINNTPPIRIQSTQAQNPIELLGDVLVILLLLDGMLTGVGMYYFGTSAEGNILLRLLMEQYGYVNTLVVTKLLAILTTQALCTVASKVSWLANAMRLVILIYIGVAIIPWSAIILQLNIGML